jgi:large subunit ribosomal protein L16
MDLMPSRVKWRKVQRGTLRGVAARGNEVAFGEYGLQALEWAWLTGRVIEAGRVAASRQAPEARVYIRVFPHKPVSKKPLETRMGKGKGEPEFWAAVIRPGMVLFEIGGLPEAAARDCLARVAYKMPFRCRFVGRRPSV